jgi:hypothetical protein
MKTSKFNEEFFAEVREMEVWKMLKAGRRTTFALIALF